MIYRDGKKNLITIFGEQVLNSKIIWFAPTFRDYFGRSQGNKSFENLFGFKDFDLNKFDRVIDELEPGLRIPVLLKKYIKQNAKVIAFNVDPLFNNAVDGLMYIKISDLPESTVRPVMEEFQAELERKFTENNSL